MQTSFPETALAEPETARSEQILRKCVHCGFCTATCPTYVLLGDERDSPRGRIYLIKDMLENPDKPVTEAHVRHVDRCLSCLSCMTTCPSGVNYMHLVDHARAVIETRHQRPWPDRALRGLLGWLLPRPGLFRMALMLAEPLRWLGPYLPGRLGAMLRLAPAPLPGPSEVDRPRVFPAQGTRRARAALLSGCAQQVVAPEINEAAIRLLTRHGVEVVVTAGATCCGALNHHLGQRDRAEALAGRTIAAWRALDRATPLDAIIVTASGCGTTIKDYGHMFQDVPTIAEDARWVTSKARDVTELMAEIGLAPVGDAGERAGLKIAYHSACSMQHGQKLQQPPRHLLKQAGFTVQEIPEAHLCCGSAGTYNLLQPEIAGRLKQRKLDNIARVAPDLVATGNVGCIAQLHTPATPVLHTVELLDWSTGGPLPAKLEKWSGRRG